MLASFCASCSGDAKAKQTPVWGYAVEGFPIKGERVAELETNTGVAACMVNFFLQWPAPGKELQSGNLRSSLRSIWEADAIPVLSWEPMYLKNGEENVIKADVIFSGEYDEYIRNVAKIIKEEKYPVLVRFAHEMNLSRYHWGTEEEEYGPESPQIYRRMYRYVVEAFRQEGASNALWVFCPNAESVPNPDQEQDAEWNRASNYYPGSDWVDIMGMDGYNWGTTRTEPEDGWDSQWKNFREIFSPLRKELTKLAPEKPLCVMETASVTEGGDRRKWIKDGLHTAIEWELDAVVWFQADKEFDWRLKPEETAPLADYISHRTDKPLEWIWEMIDEKE